MAEAAYKDGQKKKKKWFKFAAIFEVISVLLIGNILAQIAGRLIGLRGAKEQLNAVKEGMSPDYLNMAWITFWDLILKYGILFGLAFAIGWWHRKRKLKNYGITKGGYSIWGHIKLGVGIFSVGYLLPLLLFIINRYVDLGAGAAHWETLNKNAFTFGYWIFMGVSSFFVVPIVEELFVRGYFQTRLTEDLHPGSAIMITSFIFAFSHSQYFTLSVLSIGMLLSTIISSIFIGYIFYKTGSLLPGIIAHGLMNIPMDKNAENIVLVLIFLLIVIFHKPIWLYGKKLLSLLKNIDNKIGLILIVVSAILLIFLIFLVRILFIPAGILLFIAAIIIESQEKSYQIRK